MSLLQDAGGAAPEAVDPLLDSGGNDTDQDTGKEQSDQSRGSRQDEIPGAAVLGIRHPRVDDRGQAVPEYGRESAAVVKSKHDDQQGNNENDAQ